MTAAQRSLWDKLRLRLQRATQNPGARSALARQFRVSTATVSQWLSDDERRRVYPAAENTLRLLEWVTAEEAKPQQQKRAGSADTRPALKTRKRKSKRNEKAKSGPYEKG